MHRLAALFTASLALAFSLGRDSSARVGPPAPQEPPDVLSPYVPRYPPIAKAARAGGEVVVEAQTRADGSVASAAAVSGHPLLRRAAAEAALKWRFEPDVRGTTVRLTFEFRWETGDEEVSAESPYRYVIRLPKPPDTISRVPPDAEEKTCERHGFRLERDKVRISYGLAVVSADGGRARSEWFPHANSRVEGGCEVYDESPKFAEVLYCRACRAAEEKWNEEQVGGPPDAAADKPCKGANVHRHY